MALYIWVSLPSLPGDIESIVSNKNHHELIIASQHMQYAPAIFTYNVHENKWTKITLRNNARCMELTVSGFALSTHNNKLYAFNYWGQMTIVDLNAQTIEIIEDCGVNDKYRAVLVAVDDTIHLIGAQKYDQKTGITAKHFIWNQEQQKFTQLTHFPQFSDICNSAAIYVPRKKVILHIGGIDQKYDDDHEYDDVDEGVPLNKIYQYCLLSKKWTVLEGIEFEGSFMNLALTSDQCNVIIAGGAWSDDIYVLQIKYNDNDANNQYKLKKSHVKCPKSGPCYIGITGGIKDEILGTGFIRSVFKSAEFKNMPLPPLCIRKMILAFYSMEMLHWFQREGKEHFAVPIQKVI